MENPIIGTLGEKSLHFAIKNHIEPDASFHEVKLGRYVADVCNGAEIFEIQTGQFYRLRAKLPGFLALAPVTVVYPVALKKRLFWVDPGTGEVTGGRLSPRKGRPWEILPELYALSAFFEEPGLRFKILLVELDEYRYRDGWGEGNKRNASRCDRVPVSFAGEVDIAGAADFVKLIPPGLEGDFTAGMFCKASGLRGRRAWEGLKALELSGAVCRAGKSGNSIIYTAGK